MSFLQRFQHILDSLLPETIKSPAKMTPGLVIAYSGGLDSHVLLHVCHCLKLPIRAIHVHHGLQLQADEWVVHCQEICDRLNIPLDILYVNAGADKGQSPEDAARIARYSALKQSLASEEFLLTAQHADDQAETLLLQLLRGAGAAGLAAMPLQRQLGQQRIQLRPLLIFTRAEISAYAQQENLHWIEDPSNNDSRYNRNYIRQHIIPPLKQRWPAMAQSFSVAAKHQQENLQLLSNLAAIDLSAIATQQSNIILISRLNQLSVARQRNVLAYWLKRQQLKPARHILEQILQTVLTASSDAQPLLRWGNHEIRRYRDHLYLLSQTLPFDSNNFFLWQPDSMPEIQLTECSLSCYDVSPCLPANPSLKPALKQKTLRVSFRQGGECIRPVGTKHTTSLKCLFQQAGIPPWQRQKIPLVFVGDSLIAVAGYWLAADYCVKSGEPGWGIDIK